MYRSCSPAKAASASSVARKIYPWLPLTSWLARGSFPTDRRLSTLETPILIVHGTRDRIIPFSESERLVEVAPPTAEFLPVEGAGHNNLFEVGNLGYLEQLADRFHTWTR